MNCVQIELSRIYMYICNWEFTLSFPDKYLGALLQCHQSLEFVQVCKKPVCLIGDKKHLCIGQRMQKQWNESEENYNNPPFW